jgi:hypothetical protein
MWYEYLIVFVVAFVAECCAAGYTLAVARNNLKVAVLASLAVGMVNWMIVLIVIDNHALMLPSIAGETIGTAVVMRMAQGWTGK